MTNGQPMFCPPDGLKYASCLPGRFLGHWGISVVCSHFLSSVSCSVSFHGRRDVHVWGSIAATIAVANTDRSLRMGFCLQCGIYLCAVSVAAIHPSWCDGQTLSFLLASLLQKGGTAENTPVNTFGEASGLSFSSFIGYDGVMMAHRAVQPWKCSPCWTC